MGADFHGTKTVFLRSSRAITCTGQIGAPASLSGFSSKVTGPNFGACRALVYEDLGRKLHSSLKGSTLSQNTLGSENLTKEFRERPWAVISASISPKNFWDKDGDRLWHKIVRAERGALAREFSVTPLHFCGRFHFPLNFTQFWGP